MTNRKKEKIERLYRSKGIAGVSSYISNIEGAKYLLHSDLYLNKEALLILYKHVSDFDKEVILKRLDKIENDYTAPFELILNVINLEDSSRRVKSLRKELYRTRNFDKIYNYLINNSDLDDVFRYEITGDLDYALAAINYLNSNDLKTFIKDIDVNYIEEIILKDKNPDVLARYILGYEIHNNKELEKILFELNDMKLLYMYVLRGSYSDEFDRDKAIALIESSGDLELVIKTAIYLKPGNLCNINAEEFFLSVGLLDLTENNKKKLINDVYEKFSSKKVQEYKDSIVADRQKELKNKFIGNNLHN